MNNSFSLYRVGLLIKRQWATFGKIFLIALGALTLILLGYYIYNLPTKENIIFFNAVMNTNNISADFRVGAFMTNGIIFLSLTSSWYFSKWGKKSRALEEILLPASNLEKNVCGIFFNLVVCMGSFLLIFLLIDTGYRIYFNDFLKKMPEYKVTNSIIDNSTREYISVKGRHLNSFINDIDSAILIIFILIGLLVQSMFLLGSIYFKRFQYIKTLITVVIVGFVIISCTVKLGRYLNEGRVTVSYTLEQLDGQYNPIPTFFFVIIPIVTLIIYWITYLRVKEKEV